MVLLPPNQKKCTPKNICVGGPNDGVAYDPSAPCPTGYEFNPATCDCELEFDPDLCYRVYATAYMTNGTQIDFFGDRVPCRADDACAGNQSFTDFSPIEGKGPGAISVGNFGRPDSCGFLENRGVAINYSFETFCDGRPDGLERAFDAGPPIASATDIVVASVDVYLVPSGCDPDDDSCRSLIMSAASPYGNEGCE